MVRTKGKGVAERQPTEDDTEQQRRVSKEKNAPHKRPITGKWDAYDTKYLTAMKKVEIAPTRVADESTLSHLGILDDVAALFEKMGYGRLWRLCHFTYPKLVREFIATCRLTYEDPDEPLASQGILTFFLDKKHFSIPLFDFCDIYGFSKTELVCFPHFYKEDADWFWNLIAAGNYESRKAKITAIRNPVLRCAAKIMGNTLFFKDESGSVRSDELLMLFRGVKHLFEEYVDDGPLPINLGAVLCEQFVHMKYSAPEKPHKKLYIGTILTPLFLHCNIDLGSAETNKHMDSVNMAYLQRCHIMQKGETYKFWGRDGFPRFCKLPNTETSSLTSRENLAFILEDDHLVPNPAATSSAPQRRRAIATPGSSVAAAAHAPIPHHSDDDDAIHEDVSTEQHDLPQPHCLLPHDPARYRLPPAPEDMSGQLAWIIESQKTNNSMMRRMWRAMMRIRPCTCTSTRATHDNPGESSETSGSTESRVELRTKKAHDIPASSGVRRSTSPGHSDDARLTRTRRAPGQSHSSSESPPHHHG